MISAPLAADEIRWTASGSVTSVTGSGFSEQGVAVSETVSIEMSMDSDATLDGRSFIPIGEAFAGRAHFHGAIGLAIKVRIGSRTWESRLTQVAQNPSSPTIETVCWDLAGNPDTMAVILRESEGGEFPQFPFDGTPSTRVMEVTIADNTSPAELFEIHILPPTTTNTSHVTDATGAIRSGDEAISFALDPETVRVSGPPVPASIARTETGVELTWPTDIGQTYRIEDTGDFRIWRTVTTEEANADSLSVPLEPFGEFPNSRFYRVFVD